MTQEYTQRFTEVHELGGGIWPDSYAAGAWYGGWSCLANHQRAVFIIVAGAFDQGGTLDVAIQEAQDATGTNAQLLDAKYITQLDGGDADSRCIIEVRTEEMTPGYSYVRPMALVGWSNVEFSVTTFLGCSNYPPVGTTYWTEIVD